MLRLSERRDTWTPSDLSVRAMNPCCDDLHERDGRGAGVVVLLQLGDDELRLTPLRHHSQKCSQLLRMM